jgi:hypothetical protein
VSELSGAGVVVLSAATAAGTENISVARATAVTFFIVNIF